MLRVLIVSSVAIHCDVAELQDEQHSFIQNEVKEQSHFTNCHRLRSSESLYKAVKRYPVSYSILPNSVCLGNKGAVVCTHFSCTDVILSVLPLSLTLQQIIQ